MNESILQYWNRTKQYWNDFSKSQKITFITTIFLLLISVPVIIYYFSRTEYALAFTELQPNDAAAITKYLASTKTPYVLSADGKSISVPRSEVPNVKINVESQGLNKTGSLGYGSLKESSFGTTDNEFNIKKLSMIQGELQQMLNSFDAVSGSKVMITLPAQSVFLRSDQKEQSSAAVVLNLRPGFRLDQQKIDTMYNLVSKSIKDLPIENITISEQNGDLLPYSKSNGVANSASAVAMQFQVKKQFEQDIQKQVMTILGRVLGPGKVVPMVTASLNFDKKSSHQQMVTPVNAVDQKGIEISVQEIQKSYQGDGSTAGGVPGTGQTDVPTYPGGTNSGKTTSEEVQRTINYEVNRINNEIESSPFFINDLTISVGIEPPQRNNPASLTPETVAAVQKLLTNVVSASLANSGRTFTAAELSDRVTVFNQPFADNGVVQPAAANWYLIGGIGAAVLALAGVGGYLIARRRRNLAAGEDGVLIPAKAEFPSMDLADDNQTRKQLETLAKKKPEEFVNLLRTWLVDE